MYSIACSYYTKEFSTLEELIDDVILVGMDPNYEITFNGEVYNSCNYEPRKRYNIKEGIQPMRLYCRDMDCKCSAHGYKETYGKRSK